METAFPITAAQSTEISPRLCSSQDSALTLKQHEKQPQENQIQALNTAVKPYSDCDDHSHDCYYDDESYDFVYCLLLLFHSLLTNHQQVHPKAQAKELRHVVGALHSGHGVVGLACLALRFSKSSMEFGRVVSKKND